MIPVPALMVLAVAVGCVGGIYGIGGGSSSPRSWSPREKPAEVAPAALGSTFLTSVAGVITFTILSVMSTGQRPRTGRPASPSGSAAWPVPTPAPGSRPGSPTLLIRRVVGALVLAIGVRYLWAGLS